MKFSEFSGSAMILQRLRLDFWLSEAQNFLIGGEEFPYLDTVGQVQMAPT